MSTVGALILAGGQSQRMGRDKALLLYGESTFVARLVALLSVHCPEVILVGRDTQHTARLSAAFSKQPEGVHVVSDQEQDRGPLMGIYTGLCTLQQASRVLVCAVDMPLVQPAMVAFLLAHSSDDALCIPIVAGVPQVLLAVYPRTLIDTIAERLQSGRRDPRSLLDMASVRYIPEAQLRTIDPQLRSFTNINTPQELDALQL